MCVSSWFLQYLSQMVITVVYGPWWIAGRIYLFNTYPFTSTNKWKMGGCHFIHNPFRPIQYENLTHFPSITKYHLKLHSKAMMVSFFIIEGSGLTGYLSVSSPKPNGKLQGFFFRKYFVSVNAIVASAPKNHCSYLWNSPIEKFHPDTHSITCVKCYSVWIK